MVQSEEPAQTMFRLQKHQEHRVVRHLVAEWLPRLRPPPFRQGVSVRMIIIIVHGDNKRSKVNHPLLTEDLGTIATADGIITTPTPDLRVGGIIPIPTLLSEASKEAVRSMVVDHAAAHLQAQVLTDEQEEGTN